mgnify:CR=1 FL=1
MSAIYALEACVVCVNNVDNKENVSAFAIYFMKVSLYWLQTQYSKNDHKRTQKISPF